MAMDSALLPARVAMYLRDRIHAWAFRRQGNDHMPQALERRRLYILPTRAGLVFGLILFVMMLGSMNYNNSMGLALTFCLAGLGLVAMHHCHRNLLGLVVHSVAAEPVFAGQHAHYHVSLYNPSPVTRFQVMIRTGAACSEIRDIGRCARLTLELSLPTEHRGIFPLPRLSVTSTHPFMFFRCWSWLHVDSNCTVYPAPAAPGPQPPRRDVDVGSALHEGVGSDDFAGLRPYRPGDSPRHIAWKAFAREGELLVKQFTGTALTTLWLDYAQAPGRDVEERLSRLCRWVLDSDSRGWTYGLRLPGRTIAPGSGRGHRARCLEALARHGEVPGSG